MTRTTDTDAVEELSADLKAWLLVTGLSYRDVAEMIGVKMNVVHRAATGMGMVSPTARAKLDALLERQERTWREIHEETREFRQQFDPYRRAER